MTPRLPLLAALLAWSCFIAACSGDDSQGVVEWVSRPYDAREIGDEPLPSGAMKQQALQVSIVDEPTSVPRGSILHYKVRLTNPTDRDIELTPCPMFYSAYGESATVIRVESFLNCADAPAIPAKGDRTFAMEIPAEDPQLSDSFDGTIIWRLWYRDFPMAISKSIEVEG